MGDDDHHLGLLCGTLASVLMFTMGKVAQAKAKAAKENLIAQTELQAMLQSEVQKSLDLARTRDALQWYGAGYALVVSGLAAAKLGGRPVPGLLTVPVAAGAVQLANLYDAAYGTKLVRIRKEAENILYHERALLAPPWQVPFSRWYPDALLERHDHVGPVSSYWPFAASAAER